ncbi:MAG TPA: filamentous hemagglutinin N-terminal domain-containing protein, partial [Pseudomonas sp.]|nr:filamentous hemagglutinin N-terminal domain-containing protein [Pseudomonas sp.]
MNHTYRLVWNDAAQRYVPAPETAKGRGKSSGRSAVVVALGAALLSNGAWAGPSGGTVSAGSGSIAQSGATTTITQGSQNLAINWASFNVAASESVNFVQPNASAIALNRVTGNQSSVIDGSLSANGQVWILNPNGVLFGSGASVNVGGLVASTLSLSDADFLAGKHGFVGDGRQGTVLNQGSLTGGYVALLGKQVSNQGTLSTVNGSAALAAGDSVTLDFSGNQLLSVQVDAGTLNALAENKGLIRADNGTVILTASAKDALLDTVVNNQGVIEAKGIDASGGAIVLLGGSEGGTVKVGGTLDASANGSHAGGFIETSGAHVQVADGTRVSTRSDSGQTGTWLVDPTDFTIGAGSGAQTASGIGADTLSANLASTSVTLETDASSGSDSGDINVDAALNWSANTRLTLNAYNDININAAITATGTSAGLALNHGDFATTGTVASGTDYNVKAPITLNGANASLAINGESYTLLHSMAALDAIDSMGLSGNYALAQELDASGTTYTGALVGSSENTPFAGTFAGLGHTVSNLTISTSNSNTTGLFGYTGSISLIRDIGLVGGSVTSMSSAGGLVGSNQGRISNAYTTGTVSGLFYVGGLAGLNFGSIRAAYATGDVSGSSYLGGLVGYNGLDSSIDTAYAT